MTSDLPHTRLICPLTASTVEAMLAERADALAAGADTIEIRLDFLRTPPSNNDLQRLLADCPVEIIVTYRPIRQGGRYDGDEAARLAALGKAIELGAAWVDIELDAPAEGRPAGSTILSHHNFERCPDDLDASVDELDGSDGHVNKIAFAAAGPEDGLRAMDAIRSCEKPTISLAMGEAGILSRVLARKLGAFGTFAALADDKIAAPGQPTLRQFKELYHWDQMDSQTACFGVIGCPVGHSMSPAIHNAAFAAAGINGVYLPLLIQPGADNFNRFMDALLARPWMDWRGLSVTIPHKENALAYVGGDNCDPLAVQIGAINTITINADGALAGDNTDYAAAIDALCDAMGIDREDLADRTVAVLGAGGASRAIVAALGHYGARTTIYNRTLSRAEALAEEFGAAAHPLDDLPALDAEIMINCTPIGMASHSDGSPMAEIPSGVAVVFDTIYNPIQTRLLEMAQAAGRRTVSGLEMFVNQAVAQFERWTETPAPRNVMRQAVLDQLSGRH